MGELNPTDIEGAERPSIPVMLGRAAIKHCPRCGAGHLFRVDPTGATVARGRVGNRTRQSVYRRVEWDNGVVGGCVGRCVGVVGTGLICSSWAALFLARALDVLNLRRERKPHEEERDRDA